MARTLNKDVFDDEDDGIEVVNVPVNKSQDEADFLGDLVDEDDDWEDVDDEEAGDSQLHADGDEPEQLSNESDESNTSNDNVLVRANTTSEETTSADATPKQDAAKDEVFEKIDAALTEKIPADTEEIVWDEIAERKKDEEDFFESLKDARQELKLAESEWENAKSNAKIAKEEYTLAQARLYQIAEDGVVYRKKPQPKPAVKVSEPAAIATPAKQTDSKEPVETKDWKSIQTITILAGIDGLGPKKRDALVDAFPTFEHLMDARTEASKESVGFCTMLPKGIGEGIATEIINRMDKAIVPGM